MTRYTVAAAIVLILTAYAFGRYSAPEKVRTVTKIVEVEKKTTDVKKDTSRDKHRETKTVETTKPDGTKEKTTTVVEDTKTDTKTDRKDTAETGKTTEEDKEIVKLGGGLSIAALVGAPVSPINIGAVTFGLHVSRPLIGPISIGLFRLSNGILGFSTGLVF